MEKSIATTRLQCPRLEARCRIDAFERASRVEETSVEGVVPKHVLRVGQVNAEEAVGLAGIQKQVAIAIFLNCGAAGNVL
jgi:hypothetical protein